MLLTKRTTWKLLEEHARVLQEKPIYQSHQFSIIETSTISLDYSHQALDDKALELLNRLACECQTQDKILQMMNGEDVNHHLPALHTALRGFSQAPLWVNQIDVRKDIITVRESMRTIAEKIRLGQWLGYSGKPIKDVVNLGIGGSMLGPQFCIEALADYCTLLLGFHFISDFDNAACNRILSRLNPETTLFIVSSKSFVTTETLWNARKVLEWGGYSGYLEQHFIAITANVEKAYSLGFQNVLPIWPWIGGRFSICSAINLITCIAIGYDKFLEFLHGAAEMDEHFRTVDIQSNLPIMLALLGIWNNNNLKRQSLLVLTYAQSLQGFVPYLQQLEMESNGKSLDKEGHAVNYATVPIIWGGSGNQAQHSYFQMLSHGSHRLSVDLISLNSLDSNVIDQHKEALFWDESVANDPSRYIPCNHLQLIDNSPFTLGSLIALYEHKVFIQALIWNINPFDQPGVERMKQKLEQRILTRPDL